MCAFFSIPLLPAYPNPTQCHTHPTLSPVYNYPRSACMLRGAAIHLQASHKTCLSQYPPLPPAPTNTARTPRVAATALRTHNATTNTQTRACYPCCPQHGYIYSCSPIKNTPTFPHSYYRGVSRAWNACLTLLQLLHLRIFISFWIKKTSALLSCCGGSGEPPIFWKCGRRVFRDCWPGFSREPLSIRIRILAAHSPAVVGGGNL